LQKAIARAEKYRILKELSQSNSNIGPQEYSHIITKSQLYSVSENATEETIMF
jgi:hypothetical protein